MGDAVVEIWVPLIVVCTGLGAFLAAMTGNAPRTVGGMGGFVGGVGVFLPLGCATTSDPVTQAVCHTAVGIPISEATGTFTGLASVFSWSFWSSVVLTNRRTTEESPGTAGCAVTGRSRS